jgi:hypothetical protein
VKIKRHKLLFILASILTLILLSACNQVEKKILKPTTIANLYSGDILDVDKIVLVDGSTGERLSVMDNDQVTKILGLIKDESIIPEENQEGSVGYIFRVILYENDKLVMDFIPNQVQGIYYKYNEKLNKNLKEVFEEYFDRKF